MKHTATIFKTERLTRKQKKAHNYKWYKEKADFYETEARGQMHALGEVSEFKRMKVNYDLFNNILDTRDFEYVCQPFGAEHGDLPATMSNKDISSYRVKAMLGMEMRRPFGYKLLAVNPEATTRKEEEWNNRIKQYVVDEIMAPIRMQAEMQAMEELQGREPSPEEIQEIQQRIEQQIQENTPESVARYMKRKHQDPAEIQGHQILEWVKKKEQMEDKFNNGFKHALLSAYEVYYIGIEHGKPVCKVVNPLRFSCQMSPDIEFIEDAEWCVAEYRMLPSQVVMRFKLTNAEIDEVYNAHEHRVSMSLDRDIDFSPNAHDTAFEDVNTITVKHIQFPGLRKVGFLTYMDLETGEIFEDFKVDEEYKLMPENGDISITWEWIPETYEVWKIGSSIYKEMGPAQGQLKDEDNLRTRKLSYYGAIYDATNSQPTSVMDRMKVYQYYYNVIMYRIELLTATDEGKKVLMNINAIPSEAGIDIDKWQHFFKSTPFMWYNPDEEGMTHQDVNTIAKTIDLSLASDINKYIQLAEYIEQKCGKSVGVTDPVLGQTAVSERVGNNQQNLIQTGHMLEPYFNLHARIKKNVLNALLETSKICFVNDPDNIILTYTLDDMSVEMFKVDKELLNNSTLGLFMEDAAAIQEVKDTIENLTHAAMQNQKVELSDVLKVIRRESIAEAIEDLELAEDKRIEREEQAKQQEQQNAIQLEEKRDEMAEKQHERELEKIIVKEEERRKTVIQQQAMLSVGFNENKDMDGDGKLDVLEIANQGVKAQIEIADSIRKDIELKHKIENDKEQNEIKRQQIRAKNSIKV